MEGVWVDTHLQSRRCYKQGHKEGGIGRAPKGEKTACAKALRHMPCWDECEEGSQNWSVGCGCESKERRSERKPG